MLAGRAPTSKGGRHGQDDCEHGPIAVREEVRARFERGVKASAKGTVLRATATLTVFFLTYALVPVTKETTWEELLIFAVLLAALIIGVVFEIRGILHKTHPDLRAFEAMVLVFAVFLVTFSVLYLGMSHTNAHAFSKP